MHHKDINNIIGTKYFLIGIKYNSYIKPIANVDLHIKPNLMKLINS